MTPAWAQRQADLLRDCIVSPDVFASMVDRLGDFVVPYQHALETEAGQRNVHFYLAGLLSHLDRKNAETIAALVNVERLVLQEFIGTASWDHRPLLTVLVGEVVEQLGEPDGVIAFDPSSFPKRGTHSVGVKRQWCSHRGKVDNARWGSSWAMCLATTMPCLTSVCPCLRSGPGTSTDARNATCPKTWHIARVTSSVWR
jgi:SRSO17 transposase